MANDSKTNSNVTCSDKAEAKVVRGKPSWDYIYVTLGFALAIEGTIIQVVTPFAFSVFLIVAPITIWLFVFNGTFHNWLFRTKKAYEDRAR